MFRLSVPHTNLDEERQLLSCGLGQDVSFKSWTVGSVKL